MQGSFETLKVPEGCLSRQPDRLVWSRGESPGVERWESHPSPREVGAPLEHVRSKPRRPRLSIEGCQC